jgi:hypothetical protein
VTCHFRKFFKPSTRTENYQTLIIFAYYAVWPFRTLYPLDLHALKNTVTRLSPDPPFVRLRLFATYSVTHLRAILDYGVLTAQYQTHVVDSQSGGDIPALSNVWVASYG